MVNNNWGGYRNGSGRVPLDIDEKKKGVQIYITQKTKDEILEFGEGNSLSEKAVELIHAEIHKRKKSGE
ncbi:hypothetical protein BHU72_13275 [Desulfuribacillus stibiiarsenatis]|uniref:CopG family transcriptional regulator n=1 Tax=Desulfuribacillus stibiiarsenatis TaxID=1390249 RepID=A0A1E5L8K4_9FIRM|nr:hypothetical protein [Desulfuribacillus stibiiarsenatis]OEH86388.1 hypothetical protein BHU72_13275 [Desulfuribacillus stibiiarsenatis]